MFAHRVIEDLKRVDPKYPIYYQETLNAVSSIRKAHQFHFGEMGEVIAFNRTLLGKPVFTEHIEYFRLPYKICWFDYTCADTCRDPGKVPVSKRGLLLHEISEKLFRVIIFNRYDQIDCWEMAPVNWLIKPGGFVKDDKEMISDLIPNIIFSCLPEKEKLNTQGILKEIILHRLKFSEGGPLYPFSPFFDLAPNIMEVVDAAISDDGGDLSLLNSAILLLNCKNISTVKVFPPERLNRRRQKENKQPLFTYHVLSIKLPHEIGDKKAVKDYFSRYNRPHFCRGHFKHYSQDKPLFGKIVGLWWWAPQLRGRNGKGFVMKDYLVKGGTKYMVFRWTKRLKERFGWDSAKDVCVLSEECFDRECFQPHDWNHDNHLVCLINATKGCPKDKDSGEPSVNGPVVRPVLT